MKPNKIMALDIIRVQEKVYDTGKHKWMFGSPVRFDSWNHSASHWLQGPCPNCGSPTTTYGGGWSCNNDHCPSSACNFVCNPGPKPDWWKTNVNVFVAGDSWCATFDGFVNLQESVAGFGKNPREAVADLKAQHAWRTIDTAPKDGTECECINWASENLTAQLLTGHHARCPHGGDQLTEALALIAELAKGVELWAAEEDGVYDGVWKAYRKAKALQGVFLSDDLDKASEQAKESEGMG